MSWQAATFAAMPKFGSAIEVPSGAVYSGSITSIAALRAAIVDKSIDVIEWNGSYVDDRVELNTSHTNSGQRRYITGTGNLPPIRIMGGEVGKGWTIYGMTLGPESATDEGAARIDLINAKDFTLSDCARSWPGNGVVVSFVNLRGGTTRNITIQRNTFTGTQSTAREFMAVIAPSWLSDFYGNDYWSNGQQPWAADSDNIRFIDNRCHNIGDSIQLQSELNGVENRPRHYTVVDHKNVEVAGNLFTSDPGLAENAVDFKGSAQNYNDRARIHHNIISGFRPASGGGTGSIGEAIVIHFQHQHVEISDNIIDDCAIGINAKPPTGSINILRNRFSNITEIALVGEQWNYDTSTADINVDECLIDGASKLIDNMTSNRVDTYWNITNTVFRNIGQAGQTTSASLTGGSNYFDGSALAGLTGQTNVAMANVGTLAIPTATLDVFNGYPTAHAWALGSVVVEPDELIVDLDINGGEQSFSLGRSINHVGYHGDGIENTLLGDGWVAFSAAGSKIVNGSKVGTTRADKLAQIQEFADDVKNRPGVNGVLVYGRWKDYENGLDDYDTELMNGLAGVITSLKSGGKQFGFALDYKKFYANAASECPVPSYIFGSSYGVSWSTQVTQTLATAAVWRTPVRDRVMALINEMCSRYGSDIHMITVGETSMTSVESDFNFTAWDTAFRYFVSEIQTLIPHGAYLAEINFYGNNGSDISDLIEFSITVGAVCISLPDWLSGRASWTTRKIPGNNYDINAYDIIRDNYKHKIRFFPHWQTWDAEQTENWDDLSKSLELLGDVDGFGIIAQTSFVSRVQEYQTGSQYLEGNYLNDLLWPTYANATFGDYFYSGVIESTQFSGGGGDGSGVSPSHAIGDFNGASLLLEPRASALAGNSESFTIEFVDAIGTDESALIRYYSDANPNIGDGTPIHENFYSLKPGVDNASNNELNGTRWILGYKGASNYSGDGAAIAEGSRITPGTTASMLFDISHIPAGSYPLWARCMGSNTSSDSFFVRIKSNGSWSDWENLFINEPDHGALFWRKATLVLAGQPELLEMGVREDGTVVDQLMLSTSTETPNGIDGYTSVISTVLTPVANDDTYIVVAGTTVNLDVMRNDTDPAGGGLNIVDIYSPAQFGLASVVDGKIRFEAPNYAANDALQYRIIDSNGEIAIGQVNLIVGEPTTEAPDLQANDAHIMRLTTDIDTLNIDLTRSGFDRNGGDVEFSVDISIIQNTGIVFIPADGQAEWSGLGAVPLDDEMTYKLHSLVDPLVTATGVIRVTTVLPQPFVPTVKRGSDVELAWDGMGADASLDQYDLRSENGLRTAVMLSLFADRRAGSDDIVDDDDKRGWWADMFAARPIGSRLWLLDREKDLPEVVNKAHDYAREALEWLVEDGIAKTVEVDVTSESAEHLEIHVRIKRPNNDLLKMKFQRRWQTEADR